MKKLIYLVLLSACFANAQTINDYKYVIVPSKFTFLNEPDQYRLNTLTKLLLGKYGFVAYLDNEPEAKALRDHNCDKLYADVDRTGGFMITKLIVQLKDCTGNVLYATDEGKSKEKDFNVAYTMALREAFDSFNDLGYKYNGGADVQAQVVRTINNGSGIMREIVPAGSQQVVAVWSAMPATSGYELRQQGSTATIRLMKTGTADIFLADRGNQKGVVYKKGDNWFFDFYNAEQLVSEPISIGF